MKQGVTEVGGSAGPPTGTVAAADPEKTLGRARLLI